MEFDQEVDWLVAGSGAGGLTSAVTAHELGADVLVVEKAGKYGGTSALSGGVAWIPANHLQAEQGIEDSLEEGYRYLKGLVGDTVPDARLRAFAYRAPEMLRFMMEHSHVTYSPIKTYMDYYEEQEGWKPGGRSMDPGAISLRKLGEEAKFLRAGHYEGLAFPFGLTVHDSQKLQAMTLGSYLLGAKLMLAYWLDIPRRLRGECDNRATMGKGLIAKLRLSLMDRSIPLWLNSPIQELLLDDGRVCGAIVNREGKNLRIGARKGVLIATGGFSRNAEMRQQYQQHPINGEWTAAIPEAMGDGIQIGQHAGADIGFMDCAWWSPTYLIPDGRAISLVAGKAYPRSIVVNRKGKRFTNEAQPYEDFVKDQYASEARGEQAVPCYLLFDAVYRSKYAVGHMKPSKIESDDKIPKEYFESGVLTVAQSLRELAEKTGIDAGQLEETVRRFNDNALKGEDPDFARGASLHDKYYADKNQKPNPSLGPLEQPPFYALRLEPGDLDTKGGLVCDEHGRVQNTAGEPIPGLYGTGNTTAAAVGSTYPGAGATIASSMTFGYIAAHYAFASN